MMSEIFDIEREIKNKLDLHEDSVASDINISTMTMQAEFETMFDPLAIYMYIKRANNKIMHVTIKNCPNKEKRKVDSKKHKRKSEFLNQVTLIVCVHGKRNNMPISVKIFRNGTLHFTGCQTISNMLQASRVICDECSKRRCIVKDDGTFREISFASNPNKLSVNLMKNFKIDMINSNFFVPFKINRPNLYSILLNAKYNVQYDSNNHAAVNLNYKKGVTIFIFESGSVIIIVGNNGFSKIMDGYNFIYHYLLLNYDAIIKDSDITKNCMDNLLLNNC